ncbi:Nac domain-containing protein, partial [Thalictrum thalictroides]
MTIILRDEEGQPLVLPPGFKFLPTDEQLIKHYLQPKVAGVESSLFPGLIMEKDVYGCNAEEPSQIFARTTTDQDLYFFTRLKKKFSHGSYVDRVVGKGSWVIQHNNNPIFDEDTKTQIGSMKTFKFVLDVNKKLKGKSCNSKEEISWLMQEYTLTSYSQGCDLQEEWALCRIYKKVKGSGGTKRAQSYTSMSASSLKIPTQNIDPSESYMPKMKRAKTLNGFSLPPNNVAPTTSEMIFSQKDHDQYLPPFDHPQSSTHYYGSETGSTAPASVNAPFSTMGILSVNPILLDGDDDEPNNGGGNRQPLSKEDDVQCYIEDNVGMLISDAYSSQFIDQAPPAAQGSPAGLSDLQYVDYNGLIASTVEDDLGPLAEDLSIKEDDVQHYLLEDDLGMLSNDYSSQFFDQAPPAAQGSHAGLSDLQYVDYNSLASIEEVDIGPLPEDL